MTYVYSDYPFISRSNLQDKFLFCYFGHKDMKIPPELLC